MRKRDALLIIDMISSWDFADAEEMVADAPAAVAAIAKLKAAAGNGVTVAYANDLDESFHGSREQAIETAMSGRHPELVEPLLPDPDDAFIHKGQHSAFYGTPLAHLLKLSGIENVILTGQVAEQCILYTAMDAHVRGYEITVPIDAVISQDAHLGAAALEMIATNMGGRLTTCAEISRSGASL